MFSIYYFIFLSQFDKINNYSQLRFLQFMVTTSASHAEGRKFEPCRNKDNIFAIMSLVQNLLQFYILSTKSKLHYTFIFLGTFLYLDATKSEIDQNAKLHPISQWGLVKKQRIQSSFRAEGKMRYTLLYSKSQAIHKIGISKVLGLIARRTHKTTTAQTILLHHLEKNLNNKTKLIKFTSADDTGRVVSVSVFTCASQRFQIGFSMNTTKSFEPDKNGNSSNYL